MPRVLVVDDEPGVRESLRMLLKDECEVATAETVDLALEALAVAPADVILLDLVMPGRSGFELLSEVAGKPGAPAVAVLTGTTNVAAAAEAMKRGAADFVEKPIDLEALFRMVRRLVGEEPVPPLFEVPGALPLVGRAPRFRAALRLLERVAPTPTTVLLTGESGTGKELFAKALHALSPFASGPFVAVNCAAIPESLVESELFGHEKGAFTGADRRRAGRFEQAKGGTLFLDEVGELPAAVQAKLLRVLDGGGYERVGGGAPLAAEVRIVAATNRDLAAMVAAGRFRSDLHFRLEVFPIALPALAERPGDLPLLARHLLAALAERHRVAAPELGAEALAALAERSWPGNIRQLANAMERAVILHPGRELGRGEIETLLDSEPTEGRAGRSAARRAEGGGERERLRSALRASGGDKRAAAQALGLSYRTLLAKIRAHDLEGFPTYRD
jgi:DNA-binding NtrC family response regulator